jgi:hypothetical protein
MAKAKATRTIKRKVKIKYVTKCKNCGKFAKKG